MALGDQLGQAPDLAGLTVVKGAGSDQPVNLGHAERCDVGGGARQREEARGSRIVGVIAVAETGDATVRGLLFIKGSVPGHKGSWLTVSDAIKLPRPDTAPYPAGIVEEMKQEDVHVPEAGLVDDAAVHEIPALPSDEEVAAIAAEQTAHVAEEAAAAEAEAAEAADAKVEAEAKEAEAKAKAIEAGKPDADESKED